MGNTLIVTNPERQLELERRLQSIWEQGFSDEASVESVFGPLEGWLLQLGDMRLLLHPVLRQWMYFDPPHDTWQPTGIAPGQGVIAAQGKRLGLRRAPDTSTAAAAATAPGLLRCRVCGMRYKPSQRFCGYCGNAISGEAAHG